MATPRSTSRRADQIGRVLGDRYRLTGVVGAGASADVYAAEDVRLRRQVAVKTLHPALADDEAFLRRFRAEAQAAAALNHPHIMRVFDWGEEGDAPYLVLEYLAGGSLRDLLDRGYRLSPSQALLVGLEAARALDYAHRRGLVHRDIKPANLLFDEEGRLAVADFGLARALAESAWTEPEGVVLGTARYASPEQVQGASLDGRSDVYALALVLVEAVTGQVPFAADTTIATLMARVGQPLHAPHTLGPLGTVVEAAADPDLSRRLDAARLAAALDRAAHELPRPEPLPVGWAQERVAASRADAVIRAHGEGPVVDPTMMGQPLGPNPPAGAGASTAPSTPAGPAAALAAAAAAAVAAGAPLVDVPWPAGVAGPPAGAAGAPAPPHGPPGAGATGAFPAAGATGTYAPAGALGTETQAATGPEAAVARRRRWPRRLLLSVLIAVLLVGLAGAGYWAYTSTVPAYAVPSLSGMTPAQATAALASDHLHVQVVGQRFDEFVLPGLILSQSPEKAVKAKRGSSVRVWLSKGPQPRPVPDLSGLTFAAASARLDAAGFKAVEQDAYSDDAAKGLVVTWAPKDGDQAKGTTITVTISLGSQPIPDVTQMTPDQATAALSNLGFKPAQNAAFSDTVPNGQIIGTTPPVGTPTPKGATVTIIVSKGPDTTTVPQGIIGANVDDAAKLLQSAGLQVGQIFGPSKHGQVFYSDPSPGSRIPRQTQVNLYTL